MNHIFCTYIKKITNFELSTYLLDMKQTDQRYPIYKKNSVSFFFEKLSLLFLLLFGIGLTAQTSNNGNEIDNKITLFEQAVNNSVYEEAGNLAEDIAKYYKKQKNTQKSIEYFKKSLENHDKKQSNFLAIILANRNLGGAYLNSSKFEAALKCYQNALKMSQDYKALAPSKFTENTYNIFFDISRVYKTQGKYQDEMNTLQKAVKIAEELQNRTSLFNCYRALNIACKASNCDQRDYYQENFERYQRVLNTTEKEVLRDSINVKSQELVVTKNDLRKTMITLDAEVYKNEKTESELQKYKLEKLQDSIEVAEKAAAAKALQRLSDQQNAKHTRLIIVIIMGIFMFIIFFLKKDVLPIWLSKLMIFLSIILLIEFILVVLEPYVEEWTGSVILFKYLTNVAVAIAIFPFDNFLVNLFMSRVEKAKKEKEQ